jgi:class 3 adenylate cyclase
MDVPKTRWATTVDGANIAYFDYGDGPITLLHIPGWISHLEVDWGYWRYADFMRRLGRNLRVLTFDKRGTGLSDRLSGAPGLEVQMDDVRAVMDAAGVERAALLGLGSGGPPLTAAFAATHPDRTLALIVYGLLIEKRTSESPWGYTETENESAIARLIAHWGDEDHIHEFVREAYGHRPQDAPVSDPRFIHYVGQLQRYACTPAAFTAFERMWFETDVRGLLPAVHVPAFVLVKRDAMEWTHESARYNVSLIPGAKLVEVAGATNTVDTEDPEAFVVAIEESLATAQREEAELDRKLATVLFTDLVGSTDRACQMGDACWTELLEKHNATVRAFLARYRGTEVKTTGDGFLATFDGPARAVRCAQGICQAVKPLGLEVRAGCHTGEIELLGADVGGIAVHIGARVGALAGPSEVLVSSTVKDLVAGSGLTFEDRGEHELKGVPDRWHLYAVAS